MLVFETILQDTGQYSQTFFFLSLNKKRFES